MNVVCHWCGKIFDNRKLRCPYCDRRDDVGGVIGMISAYWEKGLNEKGREEYWAIVEAGIDAIQEKETT